ncbi:MAG: PAS domain S-box protein [Syntrophales bacterium]
MVKKLFEIIREYFLLTSPKEENGAAFPRDLLSFKIISIFGIVFLGIFGISAIYRNDQTAGLLYIVVSVALTINHVHAAISHKTKPNITIGLFLIYLILLYVFLTGRPSQSAILWYFILPILFFFFQGSRRGLICTILSLLPPAILFLDPHPEPYFINYSPDIKLRFLMSFSIIATFIYFIERARERGLKALSNAQANLEKRVEERTQELKESEEKYRTIIENMDEGYIEVDLTGRLTFFNEAAQKFLGYSAEETLGMHYKQYADEEAARRIYTAYNEVYRTGVPLGQFEWEVIRKDGTRRTVEGSASLIRDIEGQPVGFRGLFRDTTERKQAEEALQQSEKRFRDIADNAAEWVWEVNAEGKYTYSGPVVEQLLGYKPEEILNKHFYDLFHPEDREELRKAAFEVFTNKKPFREFLNRNLHKNGETVWLSTSGVPILDKKGNLMGYRGADTDISDRKRAEELLRRTEENFRRSMDDAPLGVRIVTVEGETIYANRAILDFCGYDNIEELKTNPVVKLYTPESFAEYQTRREKRKRGHYHPSEYDISIVRKNGEVRHLHVFRKEVLWDGERQFQVLYDDITERKRAEEALRQSEEKYRSLAHTVDSIYIVDAEQRYLFMNEGHLKRFGMPLERIVGRPYSDFHSKEDSEKFAQAVKNVFETGTSIQQDHTSARDGRFFIRTFSPVVGHSDEVSAVTVVSKDITKRKRAEEALHESETRYRAMFQHMGSGVAVYETRDDGETFIFKDFNRAGETIENIKREELIGRSVTDVFPGVKEFGILDVFKRVWRTGVPKHYPVSLYKDKRLSSWRDNFVYKLPTGEIVSIYDDVTERKRAEEAIKASHHQLRALAGRLQSVREEQRKEIAREIHDELGGALTGLKIDLSRLSRSAPKNWHKTKRDSLLSKILEMTKLIDETIGKVRRLVTELRPSILDDFGLPAALEWQLQEFQKRTGIQSKFVSTLEYINLDEELSTAVFRIFQESLTNVARHANATKVTATLYKEADGLVLKVEDNGKGISEDDIHNTKSVGLIGMRERASFLGGTVNFSGEPSKGTTVLVQFPFEA